MAISDRNINFRAPEETHGKLARLMEKFETNSRTWIILRAIDHFFVFVFTPWILREVFEEWEAFSRKIAQHGATQSPKQLHLVFGEPLPAMFPRIWPEGRRNVPQPDYSEPLKAAGVAPGTVAYASPRFLGGLRLARKVA